MSKKMSKHKRLIIYILMILPFFFPAALRTIPVFQTMVKVYKIAVEISTIYILIKRKKISKFLMVLTAYYFVILLSAFIHNGDWDNTAVDLLFIWTIYLMTSNRESLETFLNAYLIVHTILIVINLITMILYPNGMYSSTAYELNWFLGYKNVIIRILIPYLTLYMVNRRIKNIDSKKIEKKDIVIFGIIILSIVYTRSFNSFIGISVYLLLILLLIKKKRLPEYTYTKFFVGFCVTDFVMLKMNLLAALNAFITFNLNKYGSEQARIAIWNRALELIRLSPVIGYGSVDSSLFHFAFKITHPHNLLLYYLMLAGFVGLIVLLFVFIRLDKAVDFNISTGKGQINQLFAISFIAFLSMGYLESLVGATMFMPMLVITFNFNKMKGLV